MDGCDKWAHQSLKGLKPYLGLVESLAIYHKHLKKKQLSLLSTQGIFTGNTASVGSAVSKIMYLWARNLPGRPDN